MVEPEPEPDSEPSDGLVLSCLYDDPAPCKDACDDGEAEACAELAQAHSLGSDLVPQDAALAHRYRVLACDAGDDGSCLRAGRTLWSGAELPQDLDAASDFFRRSCDGGNGLGCLLLAGAHAHGTPSVAPDPVLANRVLVEACRDGVATVCKFNAHFSERAARVQKLERFAAHQASP